jgi:hypothetical protein
MGRIEEKKRSHLGKLPRSIHGKLPIERHSSRQAADQTNILVIFFYTMHSWSYCCLVGLWFRVDRSHGGFKLPPLLDQATYKCEFLAFKLQRTTDWEDKHDSI